MITTVKKMCHNTKGFNKAYERMELKCEFSMKLIKLSLYL